MSASTSGRDTRHPPYTYVSLEEAIERQGVHNLYAVVVEATVPRQTKGTDYVSNLSLTDSSLCPVDPDDPPITVELLCFAREPHQIPHLRQANDIIRLHRVKVGQYNGRPQLLASLGRPCQFCLFSRNSQEPVPYQQSSTNFFWDEREAQLLRWLREPLGVGLRQTASASYLKSIRQIQPGVFFDCICLVLDVKHHTHERIDTELYVWDGTDAQPLPPGTEPSQESPDGQDLNDWRLHRRRMLTQGLQHVPPLGTALPVCLYKAPHMPGEPPPRPAELPSPGSWVKLRNIAAAVINEQLLGLYHRNSKWTLCEADADALEEDRQRQAVNNVAGWAPAETQELVATCSHPHPFTTLRQIHQDAERRVPSRYHCMVRVTASSPTDIQQVCSTRAACHLTDASGQQQEGWVYTLQLRLEDATDELHALLFDQDGDMFFDGIPAQDLVANAAAAAELQHAITRLRGLDSDRCAHHRVSPEATSMPH